MIQFRKESRISISVLVRSAPHRECCSPKSSECILLRFACGERERLRSRKPFPEFQKGHPTRSLDRLLGCNTLSRRRRDTVSDTRDLAAWFRQTSDPREPQRVLLLFVGQKRDAALRRDDEAG